MNKIRFEVLTDDESGESGIMPCIFMNKGWYSYKPTQMPGHDLIEHCKRDETGEVYQEIRAIGAYLFVEDFGFNYAQRFWKDSHRATVMGKTFLDDLANIISDVLELGDIPNDLPEAPHAKLSKGEKDKFKLMLHAFRTKVEGELEEGFESDYEDTATFANENMDKIFGWLKFGFANAKRKYKGENYWAQDMKERINNTISTAWNTLRQYADTGEVFTLEYDLENYHCQITNKFGLI